MTTNSSPNSAWAFKAMSSMKKEPTITNTTKNRVSMFSAPPPPLVNSSPANYPPPTISPPKRNNGFAFSMVGGGGSISQPPTSSFAPAPAAPPVVPPPKRNNGFPFSMVGGCGPASHQPIPAFAPAPLPHPAHIPAHLPPSYTQSSFLPSTGTAVPIPYTNNHSYTSSASASPSQALALTPASFPPYNQFTSIPPSPFAASPLPPSLMPTTAQQPQSPSRTTISMHFLPARPAAPALAEPPAPRFVLDGLNQRTTQEMDWWTDEYSVYVNSLDEMDWDWTDDYLSDCCDVFLNISA